LVSKTENPSRYGYNLKLLEKYIGKNLKYIEIENLFERTSEKQLLKMSFWATDFYTYEEFTYMEDIVDLPLLHQWIREMLLNRTLINKSTSILYEEFKDWCQKSQKDNSLSQTSFSLILNCDKDIPEKYKLNNNHGVKIKTRGCIDFRWNIEKTLEIFKKMKIIDQDFQYVL
jgi:hypothetical protein